MIISTEAQFWIIFVVLALGGYAVAAWARTRNTWLVWALLALIAVIDAITILRLPADRGQSNNAALLVIAGTGGFVSAALAGPVRRFAKWLEKIGYRPLG